jgi:hypothetical protein
MSGSSSYTFETGPSTQRCGELAMRTQLASPVASVIADLGTGDILDVVLAGAVGPLQAVTQDNEVAGAILTSDPGFLIDCINNGYIYQARVISVNGGNCQVSIYCSNR